MQIELTDKEVKALLIALEIANVKYNPELNGNIHLDFAFPKIEDQIKFANEFSSISDSIKKQLK